MKLMCERRWAKSTWKRKFRESQEIKREQTMRNEEKEGEKKRERDRESKKVKRNER